MDRSFCLSTGNSPVIQIKTKKWELNQFGVHQFVWERSGIKVLIEELRSLNQCCPYCTSNDWSCSLEIVVLIKTPHHSCKCFQWFKERSKLKFWPWMAFFTMLIFKLCWILFQHYLLDISYEFRGSDCGFASFVVGIRALVVFHDMSVKIM